MALIGERACRFLACTSPLSPHSGRALAGRRSCCVSRSIRIRMFGITAGYHRYFSHRSYRTSRWFQFVLAWIGCSAMQKGPLWWAAHHRHHHRYSDREEDLHSPKQQRLLVGAHRLGSV